MRCLLFIWFFFLLHVELIAQQVPLFSWQNHIKYNNVLNVSEAPNSIYAACEFGFINYNTSSSEISLFNKTNGMTEIDVEMVSYSPDRNLVIVAYKNSGIEIYNPNTQSFTYLNDIKEKNIGSSKKIHTIFCQGQWAYLCTDFGIVQLNLDNKKFVDTYIIGDLGAFLPVYDILIHNDSMYAATPLGIKEASISSLLIDYNQWSWHGISKNTPSGSCQKLEYYQNSIIGAWNNSLYTYNGTWNVFKNYTDSIASLHVNNQIITTVLKNYISQTTYCQSIDVNGTTTNYTGIGYYNLDALLANDGKIYIADVLGLHKLSNNQNEKISFNQYPYNSARRIIYEDGTMWVAPDQRNNDDQLTGIPYINEGEWSYIDYFVDNNLSEAYNINCISVRPNDKAIFVGSVRNGLFKIENKTQVTKYDETNSVIQAQNADTLSTSITGLACDNNQNVWISNFGTSNPLKVISPDNTITTFTPQVNIPYNPYTDIVIDSFDSKWIIQAQSNGIVVFNDLGTITNTSDDYWVALSNAQGLPSKNVLCLAQDHNKEMWVGTDNGIGVFRCINDIFIGCNAEVIRISLDGFGSHLFEGSSVTSIAIDGGNRKWIGTYNGVYLLSEDGLTQIQHFTESNSPLLSNTILDIDINQQTGEVFFVHEKYISSFQSDANEKAEKTNHRLDVFPNPFFSKENGFISIKTTSYNAAIRITDVAGNLVHQGIAQGGFMSWDGKNYLGEPVVAGVYYISAADPKGRQDQNAQITIIR